MDKYPEMKKSGVPWADTIPSSWSVRRGKTILALLNRPIKDDDEIITCFRDGEVTLRKNRREEGFTVALQENGYQGIEPGDLVVHGMDGFAGAIGISDSRGKATPVLNVMESSQNKKFLMYYLRALAYKDVFMSLSTGIRVRSCDLRWNKLAVLPFIIPSLPEQAAIVSYLDDQLAQIDSLIAEAQASVDDYSVWRKAVIFEAVTKGLNPAAKLRDSGIEWLGKIPADWHMVRITRILDYSHPYPIGDGDHGLVKPSDYLDSGIPYIRVQNVGWGTEITLDNIVYISEETNAKISSSTLRPNDILFAKTGATIGKTGIIPESIPIANTTSHVGKITIQKKYNPKFILYVLSSQVGYNQFWEAAAKKTTRPELSIDEIKATKVLLPPTRAEQDSIVEYLERRITEIDGMLSEKQKIITDLEAYKRSLIYEAVTGKRKVV